MSLELWGGGGGGLGDGVTLILYWNGEGRKLTTPFLDYFDVHFSVWVDRVTPPSQMLHLVPLESV